MPFCQSYIEKFSINTWGVATIVIAGYVTLKMNGQWKEIKPQQNSEVYDPKSLAAINLMKKTQLNIGTKYVIGSSESAR